MSTGNRVLQECLCLASFTCWQEFNKDHNHTCRHGSKLYYTGQLEPPQGLDPKWEQCRTVQEHLLSIIQIKEIDITTWNHSLQTLNIEIRDRLSQGEKQNASSLRKLVSESWTFLMFWYWWKMLSNQNSLKHSLQRLVHSSAFMMIHRELKLNHTATMYVLRFS